MFHKKFAIFALLLAACICISAGQSAINLNGAEFPAGAKPVGDSVDAPTKIDGSKTSSTSTSSTTSTTSTTTSTTTTTTTTVPPPTPSPDTTTTPAPIPTTTPAPAPYPDPMIGTWNSSCIMIKMAAQLNFTYETKDNKTANALYNLPIDAKVHDSQCSLNTTESIQINWGPAEAQHILSMRFDTKNNSVSLVLMKFVLPLMSDRFPDAKENQTIQLIHRGFDFSAPLAMSYHCTRAQKYNLTETVIDKKVIGTVTVHDVQVQAFRASDAKDFATAHDCDSSDTSDVVPIAVGIALVGLISIVLIAYLCARRRSTSRGYVSF